MDNERGREIDICEPVHINPSVCVQTPRWLREGSARKWHLRLHAVGRGTGIGWNELTMGLGCVSASLGGPLMLV